METLKDKRVLIVDDKTVSVDQAQEYLQKMGFNKKNILISGDYLSAITIARENIQLILMDTWMWQPRTGINTTKHIRENMNWSSPKILVYSDDAIPDQEANDKWLFDWFISKKDNFETFEDAILNN